MTEHKPTISIIVANYNYAGFLTSAIESIRCQTFTDWECIIIDDASVDDSVSIIRELTADDARFRLVALDEHVGISAARNVGLDAARGEYIAFLDSDDCFAQDAMEILLRLIQTTNADMAGGRTTLVGPDFKFIPSAHTAPIVQDFVTTRTPIEYIVAPSDLKWVWIWRRLYRRDFIGDARFNPQFHTLGDDLTFMLDLCTRDCTLAECKNLIVYHRGHAQSATSQKFNKSSFDWFPAFFEYANNNFQNKFDYKFLRFIYNQTFLNMLRATIVEPKKTQQFQMAARGVLIQSCRIIPRKYLRFKFKILCWFLSCMK